jgi:disulfide bond formation protein DsbB
MSKIESKSWIIIFICWIIASISTAGSLFFSEVMDFAPCVLCWYQRICMYPLVALFMVGLLSCDTKVFKFSMPLISLGWLIAFYHNLIQWGIVSEKASPCREGLSCAAKWVEWLGFITIPFLSLMGFTLLLVVSYYYFRQILNKDN